MSEAGLVAMSVLGQAAIAAVVTLVLRWMQMRTEQAIRDNTRGAAEDAKKAAALAVVAATKVATVATLAADAAGKVATVAVRVEEVRETLLGTVNETHETAKETLSVVNVIHTLSNSEKRLALQTAMTLADRIATMTGTVADVQFARDAALKLSEHDARQSEVDERK